MSTICIFRKLPSGAFEHYITPTNSWNYFATFCPEAADGTVREISFTDYINALRLQNRFVDGMPNSIGIRSYPITICKETGRVEIAEGDVVIAEDYVYYAIECRRIFQPTKAILRRAIKTHGRDYCYLSLRSESGAGGGE